MNLVHPRRPFAEAEFVFPRLVSRPSQQLSRFKDIPGTRSGGHTEGSPRLLRQLLDVGTSAASGRRVLLELVPFCSSFLLFFFFSFRETNKKAIVCGHPKDIAPRCSFNSRGQRTPFPACFFWSGRVGSNGGVQRKQII